MTTVESSPRVVEQQSVETPTVRHVARRALFWVAAAVVVLLLLLVTVLVIGSNQGGIRLSSTNPAPQGAEALATVLANHGVTVTATDSLKQTKAAIDDPEHTTLFLYDDGVYLTDDQLVDAVALADTVVLVDPTFSELHAAAPEVAQAGAVTGALDADCSLTAVKKAEVVSAGGFGYRVVDDSADALKCLGSGDRVYSLIQLQRDAGRLIVLGTTDALTNEFIKNDGNAALAINLLGENENLVWYIPTIADVSDSTVTPADLTPAWVIPVLGLLMITALAAALWRGRRFGPLIVENLPVTVRASETMQGRARLYERGSARLRALDALRIGAIQRLAASVGLPRLATVDEVSVAVAAVTKRPVAEVRRVLVDEAPGNDTALVRLSDELLTLEHAVVAAVHPA
ncbi:MAG: DUF4350 domain-containing protein [Rhodoglobus sp.]